MPEFKIGGLVMTKGLKETPNHQGFIVKNGLTGELLSFETNPYTGAKAAGVRFQQPLGEIGINLKFLIPLNDPDTDTSDMETKELEHA